MFRVAMLAGLCLLCSVASAQYPFSGYYYHLSPAPASDITRAVDSKLLDRVLG